MKSIKSALLIVLSVILLLSSFMLTACDVDSVIEKPLRRLDVPGGVRIEDGFIVWNPVEYSSRYLISIDESEYYVEETRYSISNISDGEHSFKIRAMGDGLVYESSDFSEALVASFLDGNKTESGYYSEFDDLTKNESFLGYGFDVIRSSVFSDKYVIMSNPIFKSEELMNQRLLKVDSKVTYVDEIESYSIDEFMEQWNVSANVNVSWGKKKIGGSVDVEAAYSGGSESTASKYFHCITFNNQKFYIVLQSDMDSYRNMLTEGFKKDLYSNMEPSKLFELYGTHFITSAVMGGRINSYYLYTSDEQIDFHDVSSKVSVDVRYLAGKTQVGVEGGYRSYAESQNIDIKNTFEVVGGGDFGMNSDEDIENYYAEWEKSLNSHASLIGIKDSGSLRAIWELIDPALDKETYTWDYERIDPETKEVIHLEGTGNRAAQLEAFFYAYGLDSYNDLMATADLPEITVVESIENITVNDKGADLKGEYKVLSGATNEIDFSYYPADATNVNKSVSLAEDYSFARINSRKNLVIDYDVPHGTVIEVILSVGPISERIKVRITKTSIVEFVTNWDGDAIEAKTNVEYGWQITEPEIKERPGYIFAGWYTSFDFKEDTLYKFGESPVIEDITLYAKWEKYYPTISFVTGIDFYSIEPIKVVYGSSYTPDFAPSFDGYEFVGYYQNSEFVETFDFGAPIISDTKIYLDWSLIEYSVQFIADGNVIGSDTYTVESKEITIPNVPTKEGYYGYWKDYELTIGDIVVEAVYTQKQVYTVVFVDEGSIVATKSYTEDTFDAFITPDVPRKSGYTSKWEDFSLDYEDITVNCINTPIEYTVTFDTNGCTVTPTTKTVKYNDCYGTLPIPVRQGYEFSGWFTDSESGINITETSIFTFTQDITLYPHWVAADVTYTVNHYFMNFAEGDYTLAETYTLKAKSDSTVSPETKPRSGFSEPLTITTTVKADGTTIVDYYYNREIYKLTYKWDDGLIIDERYYYFDQIIDYSEIPTRTGYAFTRWSGDSRMPEKNTVAIAYRVTTAKCITFYRSAKIKVTDSDGVIVDIDPSLDKQTLIDCGFSKIHVSLTFEVTEIDDGYQDVWTVSSSGTRIENREFETADSGTHTQSCEFVISFDNLGDTCNFALEFGANGNKNDDWKLGDSRVVVTAIK